MVLGAVGPAPWEGETLSPPRARRSAPGKGKQLWEVGDRPSESHADAATPQPFGPAQGQGCPPSALQQGWALGGNRCSATFPAGDGGNKAVLQLESPCGVLAAVPKRGEVLMGALGSATRSLRLFTPGAGGVGGQAANTPCAPLHCTQGRAAHHA